MRVGPSRTRNDDALGRRAQDDAVVRVRALVLLDAELVGAGAHDAVLPDTEMLACSRGELRGVDEEPVQVDRRSHHPR
jgi:hypothetical protein